MFKIEASFELRMQATLQALHPNTCTPKVLAATMAALITESSFASITTNAANIAPLLHNSVAAIAFSDRRLLLQR